MDSSAAKVKTEPDGEPTVSLKKRKHEEATISKDRRREEGTATNGHHCAAPVSTPRAPSGFDPRSPRSPVPDTHDGDGAGWKAAQKVLEGLVTPSRERQLAASKPSDVVASSYVAVLQVDLQTNCSSVGACLDQHHIVCLCRSAATMARAGRELRVLLLRLCGGAGEEAGGAGQGEFCSAGAAGERQDRADRGEARSGGGREGQQDDGGVEVRRSQDKAAPRRRAARLVAPLDLACL